MTKPKLGLHECLTILGFAVFLLIPSCDTVLKYLGRSGIFLYVTGGYFLLLAGYLFVLPRLLRNLTERQANFLAIATLAGLIVSVAVVYPIANSGRFGGGTDVDDAVRIAVTELLNGRYPYYPRTYLGLPISNMPGNILLAVPFVVLGILPFQNVFWLVILFLVVRHYLGSSVYPLTMIWTMFAFSPSVAQTLAVGSDYPANTIYVLCSMWWMVTGISDADAPEWRRLLPALLLGVGLSGRTNFLLLMPLLLSVLVQTGGIAAAIRYLGLAAITCLAVTLPFLLYDPENFSPLRVQSYKIAELTGIIPFAGVIIPLVSLLLAGTLSLQKMGTDCRVLFRNSAIVQLFILLVSSILSSLNQNRLDLFLGVSGYGVFTIIFGVVAGWIWLKERDASGRQSAVSDQRPN